MFLPSSCCSRPSVHTQPAVFEDPLSRVVDWTSRSTYIPRDDVNKISRVAPHSASDGQSVQWRRSLRHPRCFVVSAVALASSTALVVVIEGFRLIGTEYRIDVLGKIAALGSGLSVNYSLAAVRDAQTLRLLLFVMLTLSSSLLNFLSLVTTTTELSLNYGQNETSTKVLDFEGYVSLSKLILNALSGCLGLLLAVIVLYTLIFRDIVRILCVISVYAVSPRMEVSSVVRSAAAAAAPSSVGSSSGCDGPEVAGVTSPTSSWSASSVCSSFSTPASSVGSSGSPLASRLHHFLASIPEEADVES